MIENQEFVQDFIDEANTHIGNIELALIKIDNKESVEESIDEIFRAVHSVKGTAGFFNLDAIVKVSHNFETLLGEIRKNRLKFTSGIVDLLLDGIDVLKNMLMDVEQSENIDVSDLIEKTEQILLTGMTKDVVEQDDSSPNSQNGLPYLDNNPSSIKNKMIQKAIMDANKFYQCSISDENGLKKSINLSELEKNIGIIGSVIDIRSIITYKMENDSFITDISYVIDFVCCLNKEIVADNIDVEQQYITEIDSGIFEGQFKPVAYDEPIQKEEVTKPETSSKKTQKNSIEDSIRVNVKLLNSLLNLAGEMVLARNQLLRNLDAHKKKIPGSTQILQNVNRLTTELQEKIMQTRMQSLSNIFVKFPRIIRDLSKKLNKDIELRTEGENVELDKSIIEALTDPLVHLIRNAADHGVEMPEEREKKGKPRNGLIIIKAYHEGGYVNIDIVDNGAGINSEAIKKKALNLDLINQNDLNIMSNKDIIQLIFKPGFSTAEKASEVSGRGVGMDVVKNNIEKLGGTIEVFTELGKGSTFKLILPLTLAIIPSLIVDVEGAKYALPQVNLQEIVRIKASDTANKIEFLQDSEVLRLRGKVLPIVHLANVLGIECRRLDYSNIKRILIIKLGSRRFGIVVDAIYGVEEILVKTIPKYYKNCICYSGVTIMGDGKTAMILDLEGIIVKAGLRFSEDSSSGIKSMLEKGLTNFTEKQRLILFKCSGPEILAIDISMVSRINRISVSEIECVGDKEYLKVKDDSLRLIRPEKYLSIQKDETEYDKYFVIFPKLVSHPIGILVSKIYDTLNVAIKLDQSGIHEKGFFGSAVINNKLVLLVNIYELFEKVDPENYSVFQDKKTNLNKVILLVEDTSFFRVIIKNYLQTSGYTILAAENGLEALEVLKNNKVDLVVSDIVMPVMDGLELIKRIREQKEFLQLPVIALTSLTYESQKNKGLSAGFDYYENKLDKVSLLNKIELALGLNANETAHRPEMR